MSTRRRARGLAALVVFAGLLAPWHNGQAQEIPSAPALPSPVLTPSRGAVARTAPSSNNVIFHGGPVMPRAKVVLIFWGPTFAGPTADAVYAAVLTKYRDQLGATPEYLTLLQYGIQPTALAAGTPDWIDNSTPPAEVSDALVQAEVRRYLANHAVDASTIYEVVLPSSSYSSLGAATSCGGSNLQYCAYHGWIGSGANAVKYSIQPYPSCAGCQVTGWAPVQNQEHFIVHETREAVTDPVGTGWWDAAGYEADDKCAWTPSPFLGTGGYAYQYEWSNLKTSCVQTIASP